MVSVARLRYGLPLAKDSPRKRKRQGVNAHDVQAASVCEQGVYACRTYLRKTQNPFRW